MMNKNMLIAEFTQAVMDMKSSHDDGTYYWYLHTDDNNNDWAIVLGWQDGYEEDETDDCMDGTYRICAKLAYQSHNSIMQCDYDIDWMLPYNEDAGEVDCNELGIYPGTDLVYVVNWLLKCYESYVG